MNLDYIKSHIINNLINALYSLTEISLSHFTKKKKHAGPKSNPLERKHLGTRNACRSHVRIKI